MKKKDILSIKGQVSIPIIGVITLVVAIGSSLTSYYSAMGAQSANIAVVSQNVAVVQTEQENTQQNISDIKAQLTTLTNNLDQLLLVNGLNPKK